MNFAEIARKMEVPILCIGTELHNFVQLRPTYWKALILKIKEIYPGKLTYAENWDQFSKVPFWKDMDYIGIDAYFPLSDMKTPTVIALRKAWQPHKNNIENLYQINKKPVLFTEFGYRSVHYTAKTPWMTDQKKV